MSIRLLSQKRLFAAVIGVVILISAAYVNAVPFDPEKAYVHSAQWGSQGTQTGQFQNPTGIAVDQQKLVYVADTGNDRIQLFTDNGHFIRTWGSAGDGDGQFNYPYGIAVNSRGDVYVTDQQNNKVQKFNATGALLTAWGTIGSRDGDFKGPKGIAVDKNDMVYVVDSGNNRVQKFDQNGKFILKFGGKGKSDGQFMYPGAIAVDGNGLVYVLDYGNNRVQVFNSNGEFKAKWGGGTNFNFQLNDLLGTAGDYSGGVYVASSGNTILKYSPEGSILNKFNYESSFGGSIAGIAVDNSGNIYITDRNNNLIEKLGSIASTFPNLQYSLRTITQRLSGMIQGSTSETLLVPPSVDGTIVTSGEIDSFGAAVTVGGEGNSTSIPTGDSAKVTAFTIQNLDKKEHKIRVQIGYENGKGQFFTRQDLKVVLKARGMVGDTLTLPMPEPFFVPQVHPVSTGLGTNIFVRTAADTANVQTEISLSVVLNP